MRPRGILKKEILKSCASAEQRLLVENTTLPLRLSDEHPSSTRSFCSSTRMGPLFLHESTSFFMNQLEGYISMT
ncbi:Ribosomal protein S16 [Fusarium oxysporum f. sp. albedinis]|nr:Ribosomal protein S16 [Fusarium oxysporum f. sp. albedinis]